MSGAIEDLAKKWITEPKYQKVENTLQSWTKSATTDSCLLVSSHAFWQVLYV